MKISASLYSDKNRSIQALVQELDAFQIDAFHIDCNDDIIVFDDIKVIKSLSKTIIDLHIITKTPEKYKELLDETPVDWVTYQYEELPTDFEIPSLGATKMGLAITNNTSIDVFEKYKNQCSFILLMTTVPGQSGGAFNTDTFKKIRQFKAKYPNKDIHVDGGVNNEVSFILRDLGVYSSVSGSYLLKNENLGSALYQLKAATNTAHFLIKDFMIEAIDLPVLNIHKADFKSIVSTMEQYKQGFVLLVDDANTLKGITSNADVRRGILKNIDDLSSISATDIINSNPISTQESNSITQMLQQIKSLPFTILFIPVIDEKGILKGAVTFNHLIKGEL